jgi:uncharacterized lipoprotein
LPLRVKRLLVVTVLACLGACSIKDVQQAPATAGTAKTYNASFDRVKQAALSALTDMRLPPTSTEDQDKAFVMLLARPPHGMSWGEVGRVLIDKSANPPITVHALYDRRMPFQFAGSEAGFARNLFTRMDKILGAGN